MYDFHKLCSAKYLMIAFLYFHVYGWNEKLHKIRVAKYFVNLQEIKEGILSKTVITYIFP